MASSSSSSHSMPVSVSQSWKHDVFLSFRGEDTRNGFVDRLYAALVQRGIETYMDDKTLPRGETIGPALLKAIQESRIAVIVFSKNYADSSWCLDELAHILECKDKIGQIVMPVFYDVDPSDVRTQKRKYGEAFTKHERDNEHKVELWKEALVKAGNISGWVSNDFANGYETKCIKDIVEKVSAKLPQLISNDNEDLIGIEPRLQDLRSELEIGLGGVRMVGIWGVGGGGKTTLASAMYMEISHQFEACCLLENIREESSKHGLKKMQENLLSSILNTKVEISSEIEGKTMIKRRLCHKSVLVVLDDVNKLEQLEALAGSQNWFGDGSRIIITTRDEHLLNVKGATIYEVSLLSDDEAAKLFSRHAFHKDEPVEEYKALSQEVVSYACKLPLALKILGSFLYDKDKDEWKSTLAKLICIPDVDVMERLKISYDGLKHDEKELFLDIACAMRRRRVDEAMRILDACGFHTCVGVRVLEQKSLIKVSNGIFDMHDLVEEMAHYIVRGESPNNPEKFSRIWEEEDVVNLFDMGEVSSSMETEVLVPLVFSDLNSPWRNLQMPSYDNCQHPYNVIAKMNKLRWIDLVYWESSFPSNFQPRNLGCLMLPQSKLEQLWEGFKLLPNLKILDLGLSKQLIRTPDFRGLPLLERLNLDFCENLKEIHPSIGYHERLLIVEMQYCKKLETFPPIIHMKSLKTLDLSNCKLQMFPDIQMNMDSLETLLLPDNCIEIIPHSVGRLCTNLVYFNLLNCRNLKRIEGNFRLLKRLNYLDLTSCFQLEKLASDFFNEECCLEELSLSLRISSLGPKLPQFPRYIRKLVLGRCKLRDEDFPSDMNGLLNLQILDLSYNNFSHLQSSLSQIPCLKFLNLSNCKNLVEVPDLPSSIAILIAEFCLSLQSVGDFSNYKWLWKVSVYGNNKNMLNGAENVLHSMFQRNAVEDRFMSIMLQSRPRESDDEALMTYNDALMTDDEALMTDDEALMSDHEELMTMALQLPQNWYNEFGGFLLSADYLNLRCRIVIKPEMSKDSQLDHDHLEEFENIPESFNEYEVVGYIPFSSLRHTSWWNTMHTRITFEIEGAFNPKVRLVPRKSESKERLECWEEKGAFVLDEFKTFEIEDASKSSEIEILWRPSDCTSYVPS